MRFRPIWLGGLAIGAGIGWTVLGLLLASRGFSVSVTPPTMAVTNLTGLWIVAQAVLLSGGGRADNPPATLRRRRRRTRLTSAPGAVTIVS